MGAEESAETFESILLNYDRSEVTSFGRFLGEPLIGVSASREPVRDHWGVTGFRCLGLEQTAHPLYKLGLRTGDLVRELNGEKMKK